jgi:hemerythrin
MASLDRADPIIMGHILAQHRDLHVLMASAKAALAAADSADAERVQGLLATLRELRDYLREHFAQEEAGGFLEESVTRMPRLSKAMDAVLAEHPGLLAELDGLIEVVERADIGAGVSAQEWERADHAFNEFVQHLLAHERNENAVVQEGYNEDLGLVD